MSLCLLTALLEGEGQIVETLRGFLFGLGRDFILATGSPIVGNRSVRVLATGGKRLAGLSFGRLGLIAFFFGLFAQAFGLGFSERGEDIGQVVQLDQLRRVLDYFGLADPLARRLVEVAAATPESEVGRDGQVVDLVVDQDQASQIGNAIATRVEELAQLGRGCRQEVGSLQRGFRGEFAELIVAARIHRCGPPSP